MPRRAVELLILLTLATIVTSLVACCHANVPAPESSPIAADADDGSDLAGQEVVAIVERLELNAHEEFMTDGSVLFAHLVALTVVEPRRLPMMVMAHTRRLPAIGTRRIQLGDRVTFRLPAKYSLIDPELEQLEGLAFLDD